MTLNLDGIYELVVVILALSAASERLVAIFKGIPWFGLAVKKDNEKEEQVRVLKLRVATLVASFITAAFAAHLLVDKEVGLFTWVGLGVLASGGSDLWNSILGWVNAAKDAQKKLAAPPGPM